ncbi:alpha-N-acetylgalactosaminide alpha-2,6-sialyltransferase 1-like [Acanthaster planci]|uniref:alpha-N-acetylgalactosaminide alpha-2,6-sialyltransferase n=1 Tax=Acanthaster planci TaxID=133434 RepID=A0A8B7XG41_ACAPL|nr:alpha-N-acetylgalactosaminide alpha-2,6-sialyltransferase 1-like [Acanthaster planci]XP_022079749.1 alpha-N-acetylgalactosaminide alpha-2,6-sialyltransferase 1-like [Acanthaster planci]
MSSTRHPALSQSPFRIDVRRPPKMTTLRYLNRAFLATIILYGLLAVVVIVVHNRAQLNHAITDVERREEIQLGSISEKKGPLQTPPVRENKDVEMKEERIKDVEMEVEKKKKKEQQEKSKRNLGKLPFTKDRFYKPSGCPKTLSSVSKYSKWFRDRFRPGVKVFLDKEDLRNYDALKQYVLPFGVRGMNNSLFNDIIGHPNFANPDLPLQRSSQACIRCAVVGCGGILNGSGAGKEIDSHDYVFRLNRAISKGSHAQNVGTKTTFYTFFPESEHVPDVVDKDVIFFYTMFKTYDTLYALNMIRDMKPPPAHGVNGLRFPRKPQVKPSKLKLVHPSFIRYIFANYLDGVAYRPTTGAIVVLMSIHLCDEVTIYGFGYDHRFTLHYYDTKFVRHTDKATALHDVDNERKLWQKLHDEGIIRLFKRDL